MTFLLMGNTAMTTARARLPRYTYFLTLLVWGGVPPLVMIILLISPRALASFPGLWAVPAIFWSICSLILFYLMLRGGLEKNSHTNILQNLLGLTCTFALGLPAIFLSALPLFGSPAYFLESLDPSGTDLDLSGEQFDAGKELSEGEIDVNKTLYIIGIDLSSSHLRDQGDDRLQKIYSVLDSLFTDSDDSSFADSLNPGDLMMYFGFAGPSYLIHTNEQNEMGREANRLNHPSKELPALVSPLLPQIGATHLDSKAQQLATTDIVGFLDKARAQIQDRKGNYDRVRLLLFSDLLHSVPPTSDSTETIEQKRNETLEKIRSTLQEVNGSIIAFRLDPHKGNLTQQDIDIGSELSLTLKSLWSEINVEQYSRAKPQERALLCENLYSEFRKPEPIFLKYLDKPNWEPIASRIHLPVSVQDDRIFLGLRTVANSPSPIKVGFQVGRLDEFVLNSGGGKNSFKFLDRNSSEQNPLLLQIEADLPSAGEAKHELLIAAPKRSILYKVQLVPLPVIQRNTIISLKIILIVLHLFPLLLAIAIIKNSLDQEHSVG